MLKFLLSRQNVILKWNVYAEDVSARQKYNSKNTILQ